jgi:hypothetical protein
MNTSAGIPWAESLGRVTRRAVRALTRPVVMIALCALAVHGLLLLNDGVYWDGWLIYTWLKGGDRAALQAWASESGVPWLAYLHAAMGRLPDVVAGYKAVAFALTLASALLVYRICRESGFLGRFESVAVALLSLCYPAFQARVELILLPYLLFYALFLLGVWLALRAERAVGARQHIAWRCGALACLYTSFAVNSLLLYHFGALLFLFLSVRQTRGLSWLALFTRLLPRRADYLAMPVLYWIVTRALFPVHGHYAASQYNQISFSPGSVLQSGAQFFANGLWAPFNESLLPFVERPALFLLALVLSAWGYQALRVGSFRWGGRAGAGGLLAYGLMLLAAAILPYVAVGKWPTAHGWESRHALLMAVPVALVTVAVLRLAFSAADGRLGRTGWVLAVVLVAGFSLSTIDAYVGWQARWVKDRSVMLKLADMPQAKACSVFWIDDRLPFGGEDSYRFYEWAYLYKQVWGDERRIGIDHSSGPERLASLAGKGNLFTSRWALGGLDPAGPQARLTIRCAPGRTADPYRLSALYQFYRFMRPGKMDAFLRSVAEVDVQPLPTPWVKGQK